MSDHQNSNRATRGPVFQSPISAKPGLNFNQLFLFIYFCMIICLKTLENKTPIEPKQDFWKNIFNLKFNLEICVDQQPGPSCSNAD
jgi:hypothetical protein